MKFASPVSASRFYRVIEIFCCALSLLKEEMHIFIKAFLLKQKSVCFEIIC